jgi:hypothetical protein
MFLALRLSAFVGLHAAVVGDRLLVRNWSGKTVTILDPNGRASGSTRAAFSGGAARVGHVFLQGRASGGTTHE